MRNLRPRLSSTIGSDEIFKPYESEEKDSRGKASGEQRAASGEKRAARGERDLISILMLSQAMVSVKL